MSGVDGCTYGNALKLSAYSRYDSCRNEKVYSSRRSLGNQMHGAADSTCRFMHGHT